MIRFVTLLFVASLAFTASAAEKEQVAKLRVDRGNILSSQGGEFATAQTGQVLLDGERLLVPEGGVGTVIFDNGCEREYSNPGVYVIDRECKIATINNGSSWAGAAKVAAGVAVGAALLDNMDKVPGPPVSR